MAHRLPWLVRQKDKEGVGILGEEIATLGAAKGVGPTQIGIGDRDLVWYQPHAAYRIEGQHSLGLQFPS